MLTRMVFGCAFPKRSRARTAEDDFGNVAARRKFSSVANGRNSREDGEKTNPVMKAIPQMKKLDTSKLKQLSLGRQVERGE